MYDRLDETQELYPQPVHRRLTALVRTDLSPQRTRVEPHLLPSHSAWCPWYGTAIYIYLSGAMMHFL